MRQFSSTVKSIARYLPAVLVAFASGLILNGYYQLDQHYQALSPRGQIAVFIAKGAQASHQLIGEKILNVEGVASILYISQDRALEAAMKDAPALKDVIVTGDNPFTPYFLVNPKEKSFSGAQWLKTQLLAVEGVEDIRLDGNTFNVIEQLGVLRQWYVLCISLLFLSAFVLAIARLMILWMTRLIDVRRSLRLVGGGVAAGIIGGGIYFLLSTYVVSSPSVRIPIVYGLTMVAGAILAVIGGENLS